MGVWDLLVWAGLVVTTCGVATAVLIAAWERWVRHETAAARALVEARESVERARRRRERASIEALAASERRHRALVRAGAIAAWRAAPDGRILALEGWAALTGQADESVLGRRGGWLLAVVPEDRDRAAAAWEQALSQGSTLDLEARLRTAAGDVRWCRVRAVALLPPAAGGAPAAPSPTGPRSAAALSSRGDPPSVPTAAPSPTEWIGVVEDVDERRRLEETRLLLSRETNHRARNLLSVVQAVVQLTPAAEGTPLDTKASIAARVAALARAHDLLAETEWRGADLAAVAGRELAAWMPTGTGTGAAPRVRIAGPPMPLAAAAVQPLAMAVHELATNAAKHGALSDPQGVVTLHWERGAEDLRIDWSETGGPAIAPQAAPRRRGFGTRVLDATIGDQLGGRVERAWCPGGLVCRIHVPLARVLAPEPVMPAPHGPP